MRVIALLLLLKVVNGLPRVGILTTNPTENPCKDVSPVQDVLLPSPYNCVNFIQCVNHFPVLRLCPEGLHFSAGAKRCEWPELARCTLKKYQNNPCQNVSEEEDFLLPNPINCSTFIQCVHQKPVIRECPENMHWSVNLTRCEYPWVAKCNATEESSRWLNCDNVPEYVNVLLPNIDDCGSFIQCVNKKPEIMYCPDGLHWSVERLRCDYQSVAKCNSVHSEISSLRTLCKGVPDMGDVLLENPDDCSSYIQCVNEKPVAKPCPEGLHFSPTRKRCEWPTIAQCEIDIYP